MKPCRHPTLVAWCDNCWLYQHDERFRCLWDGLPKPKNPRRPTAAELATRPSRRARRPQAAQTSAPAAVLTATTACAFLGEPLTGSQRQALRLTHTPDWRWCGKGHGIQGAVCRCQGCGPGCPDYTATPSEETEP